MTPDELRTLGSPYGRGWQARLARDLPVNSRTVRRWLAGQTRMHRAIGKRVRQLIAAWR